MKIIKVKELVRLKELAYSTAELKGFHSDNKPHSHNLIMSGISEIGEMIEARRKGMFAKMETFELMLSQGVSYESSFKACIKDTFEDEIADVAIWLFDLVGITEYKLSNDVFLYPSYFDINNHHEFDTNVMSLNTTIISAVWDMYDKIKRVFLFAFSLNIDLIKFIELKLKYNSTRPVLHGKKF